MCYCVIKINQIHRMGRKSNAIQKHTRYWEHACDCGSLPPSLAYKLQDFSKQNKKSTRALLKLFVQGAINFDTKLFTQGHGADNEHTRNWATTIIKKFYTLGECGQIWFASGTPEIKTFIPL